MACYRSLTHRTDPSYTDVFAKVMDTFCMLIEGTKNLSYVEFDKQFVNMVGKQMLAAKLITRFHVRHLVTLL